jgi:hypothetical protein
MISCLSSLTVDTLEAVLELVELIYDQSIIVTTNMFDINVYSYRFQASI